MQDSHPKQKGIYKSLGFFCNHNFFHIFSFISKVFDENNIGITFCIKIIVKIRNIEAFEYEQ